MLHLIPTLAVIFLPLAILQSGLATGIPAIDAVANLSIAIALLVAIGKGWLVPGGVHTSERERTARLDTALDAATTQNAELLEIAEDILKIVERNDVRETARDAARTAKERDT